MPKSFQVRWIEHAESRSVREHAMLQRAASEPHVSIANAKSGSPWFDWLRELRRPLARTTADPGLPPPLDMTIPAQAHATAALKVVCADADDDRIPAAVLITDIVGSTKLVAEMGDRNWRVLLDRHDNAIRDQIKRFGGIEAGNRGDGFVVVFDTPLRAVCCATAIADRVGSLGISLRCGLHFGRVHFDSNKISGIAAHIAARIAATARPGEALVSKTAYDLVLGSGLVFEDRGIHRLRDVPEEIRLYSVRAIAAPKIANITDAEAGNRNEQPSWTQDGHGSDLVVSNCAEQMSTRMAHAGNGHFGRDGADELDPSRSPEGDKTRPTIGWPGSTINDPGAAGGLDCRPQPRASRLVEPTVAPARVSAGCAVSAAPAVPGSCSSATPSTIPRRHRCRRDCRRRARAAR